MRKSTTNRHKEFLPKTYSEALRASLCRIRSSGFGFVGIVFGIPDPNVVLLHQRLKIGALHASFFSAPGDVRVVSLERLLDKQPLDFSNRFLSGNFLDSFEIFAG